MFLRLGVAMMSAALLMVGAAVFYVSLQREESVAVAEAATKEPRKTSVLYGEPQEIALSEEPVQQVKAEAVTKSPEPTQRVKAEAYVPAPEPEQRAEPAPADSQPTPVQEEIEPQPVPEPERVPAEPEPLPATAQDWPAPTREQVQAAGEPRHYELAAGAVMGLTVKAIGLHNVPVFDSNEDWALDSGVRHVPETSMPWSGGAQRNVYLEGHRLGYPGTGSHLVFYNLDRLGKGDGILLKGRDGTRYKYRVVDTFVVDPSDSWVMGQIRNRDLVTLQTCTGPGYSKRLIVRAERV